MSDLKAKMHPNRFRLGLRPKASWGAYTALPRPPIAGFKGLTSKGRGITLSHISNREKLFLPIVCDRESERLIFR